MSDLRTFERDAARLVPVPPFDRLVLRHRQRRHRRNAAMALSAGMVAVLALVLTWDGPDRAAPVPAVPRPTASFTTTSEEKVPEWTPEQIVGHPDAFATEWIESRTDPGTVLTVWKRCLTHSVDADCLGREAISIVNGMGDGLLVPGVVSHTFAASHPSAGVIREVGPGVFYWAHQGPGPYLMSATMHAPVHLTLAGGAVAPRTGLDTVECPDGIRRCLLDRNARTLTQVALPEPDEMRWATPTTGGFWGVAHNAGGLQLVVQQTDRTFAEIDLPKRVSITMAEGGARGAIGLYVMSAAGHWQLFVSRDRGHSWSVYAAPAGPTLREEYPRLRVLLPSDWASLPVARTPALKLAAPKRL